MPRRAGAVLVMEHAGDLDDEQRVAARVRRHALGVGAIEPARIHRQARRVVGRQLLDPQRHRVGQAAGPVGPVLEELPSSDANHEQRNLPCLLHELLDQIQQQRVGLVQILEHQDHRTASRETGEHREHALAHLRELVAAVVLTVGVQAEREAEPARGRVDLARVDPRRHRGAQALLDVGGRHRAVVAELALEHLRDRPELDVFLEGARASDQYLGFLGEPREELGDHARLPDPRLAEQRHEVRALSRGRAFEHVVEERQLAAAVDERDPPPVDDPAAKPEHRPCGDRALEPLRLDRPRFAEVHGVAGKMHRRRAREDLPGRRGLLQPRAEVHLGADHDRAVLRGADGHLPGSHADPDLDRRAEPKILAEVARTLPDVERRADGAHRVVVAPRRDAEDDEHRVTDESLRDAAVPRGLLRHHPVERRQDLAEPLRVQLRRELGRARHVDEDHRHQPALGCGRDGDRRAAVGTEVRTGRQRPPAPRTRLSGHRRTR